MHCEIGLLATSVKFSLETLCLSQVARDVLPFSCTPYVVHPGCVVSTSINHLPQIHLCYEG